MTKTTLCHWALSGAMKHLETLKHLKQMYTEEGNEKMATVYAQSVRDQKDLIKEIKAEYRNAEREVYGVACANEEYFKRMYGEV